MKSATHFCLALLLTSFSTRIQKEHTSSPITHILIQGRKGDILIGAFHAPKSVLYHLCCRMHDTSIAIFTGYIYNIKHKYFTV